MKGGPETVALHSIFAGISVPAEEMRKVLGLTMEQFRSLLTAAAGFGLVESDADGVLFVAFQKDSSQGARLDWCLEGRQDEVRKSVLAMKGTLMLRFLGSPPKGQP